MARRQTFGDKMAALKNARHERFAQLIAEGKTQDEAYKIAGYAPSRANASTLRAKQNVSARVDTLLERAAVRTEMTIASLTERLVQIADKGENLRDAAGLGVARLSLMDAAKLNGLITDKIVAEQTVRNVVKRDPATAVAEWESDVAVERGGIPN